MVISAVASPNSPFQTSVSLLCRTILTRSPLPEAFGPLDTPGGKLGDSTINAFPGDLDAIEPSPCASWESLSREVPALVFDPPLAPSPQISAILWTLETSTDPAIVESAAALVPELHWWPVTFSDLALRRLADTFSSCFGGAGRPRGSLWTFAPDVIETVDDELNSLVHRFIPKQGDHVLLPRSPQSRSVTTWTLRFNTARRFSATHLLHVLLNFHPGPASLEDPSLLAELLFWLDSFFSATTARDRCVPDKLDLERASGFRDNNEIGDLLQALVLSGPIQGKPTPSGMRTILAALSPPMEPVHFLVLRVLLVAEDWFRDSDLGPILEQDSVWAQLGAFPGHDDYLILGDRLSNTDSKWKQIISQNLLGWLGHYRSVVSRPDDPGTVAFRSVLPRLGGGDYPDANGFHVRGERSLMMVFSILADRWDRVDLATLEAAQHEHNFELLERTISIIFSPQAIPDGTSKIGPPSEHFEKSGAHSFLLTCVCNRVSSPSLVMHQYTPEILACTSSSLVIQNAGRPKIAYVKYAQINRGDGESAQPKPSQDQVT
ncbi:hypothetical protein B0H14DRAFT_2584526 [Mycena olivaceomarginata]|nr:hypothetical protein B0H14DRAFT_2584526 [Mycena olivaceomarginata]